MIYLEKVLFERESFFKLFIDFKGYMDLFLLQDCVDDDYNGKLWLDTSLFETLLMPKTIDKVEAERPGIPTDVIPNKAPLKKTMK